MVATDKQEKKRHWCHRRIILDCARDEIVLNHHHLSWKLESEMAETEKNEATAPNSAAETNSISARWGEGADAGFAAVPNALIWGQSKLGLKPNEVLVLLHLISHWWSASKLPYPRTATMAKRMGLEKRTIQRALASLTTKGFVTRAQRSDGRIVYDLSGLKEQLGSHVSAMGNLYRPGLTNTAKSTTSGGEGSGVQTP